MLSQGLYWRGQGARSVLALTAVDASEYPTLVTAMDLFLSWHSGESQGNPY